MKHARDRNSGFKVQPESIRINKGTIFEKIPFFAPTLKDDWKIKLGEDSGKGVRESTDPETGGVIEVCVYSLKWQDASSGSDRERKMVFVLERGEAVGLSEQLRDKEYSDYTHLTHRSPIAEGYAAYSLPTAKDHKHTFDAAISPGVIAVLMAEVCAYAEQYLVLDAIAGKIVETMTGHDSVWKDVAVHPVFWVALGTKLRCRPLFEEAMRHAIGTHALCGSGSRGFKELPSSGELQHLILQHRETLNESCNSTIHRLLELTQSTETGEDKRGMGKVITDVFLKLRPQKPQVEQARYLATIAYSQWLANMLQSTKPWFLVKGVGTESLLLRDCRGLHPSSGDVQRYTNLQMICKAISKAHEAQNLTIFGCNAPYHLADYFHLTGWKKHRTRDIVTKELFGILAHARRTIGN
ncbi:hypothetical protein LTS18_013434, partial [Coniosporium uncinatum]